MILKFLFDRFVAFIGLLFLWPVIVIVAILVKVKMSGGPAFFVQKRVGLDGKLFNCHKFRTMIPVRNNEGKCVKKGDRQWSSVSVAGDSRITPFGAKLRHYKMDELPGLWDVLIGKMSFVGPRPDVPGYADKLVGDDRDVLKLRPGITGPATLKYRLEDEYLANARILAYGLPLTDYGIIKEELEKMSDQEVAVWYNDNVIYPDKVRLNCYYYRHYSFIKDIQMILCTILGKKMKYAGELI
jgi:lipopolysaccharide/colanic/teichoic acid biosynthesis glycosyltransferase